MVKPYIVYKGPETDPMVSESIKTIEVVPGTDFYEYCRSNQWETIHGWLQQALDVRMPLRAVRTERIFESGNSHIETAFINPGWHALQLAVEANERAAQWVFPHGTCRDT